MRSLALVFILSCCTALPSLWGQQREATTIVLRNPSFEDMPRNSMPPIGWVDCGWVTETAPDVQPDPMNQFRVTMAAQDGNTYLGMVVRDNDTWERVGQELSEPLVGGQCYAFRIHLARSRVYLSQSRITNQPANYVTPTKLRIHAGYDLCDRREIIGETDLVTNYDWQEYKLKLSPTKDYTHLVFEVFYRTPVLLPYNGNLLLDNASPLRPIECDKAIDEVPTVLIADNTNTKPEPVVRKIDTATKTPEPMQPIAPEAKKIKLGQTVAAVTVNTVFQINDITFRANSADIEPISEMALDEIVGFLNQNPSVAVEIGGYASSQATPQFAREISVARAEKVVEYLRLHGISTKRLYPKGYGNTRRLCNEATAECQRRNQRVEVKILSLTSKD